MIAAKCPGCQVKLDIQDPKIGQKVLCWNCKKELKIIWLLPLEVDFWEDSSEHKLQPASLN